MAVAIMAATVTKTPERNPNMVRQRDHHRVRMTSGEASSSTKFMQIEVRKKTNMTRDPIFNNVKTVLTSDGKAIVAPASSCDTNTDTGLNQNRGLGSEQCVTPSSL